MQKSISLINLLCSPSQTIYQYTNWPKFPSRATSTDTRTEPSGFSSACGFVTKVLHQSQDDNVSLWLENVKEFAALFQHKIEKGFPLEAFPKHKSV